jgi:hypothetical protein
MPVPPGVAGERRDSAAASLDDGRCRARLVIMLIVSSLHGLMGRPNPNGWIRFLGLS